MEDKEKEYLIEHMKMTQDIITRMNKNSFQLKSWMLTIVSACLALFGSSSNVAYIWISIVPTIVFWSLDSFYLKEERKYVALHEKLVEMFNENKPTKNIKFFDLSTKNYKGSRYNFFAVLFSKTERRLYLSTVILLVIAGIILQCAL